MKSNTPLWLALLCAAIALFLTGCSDPVEKSPESIILKSGTLQIGAKGGETAKPLEVQVVGPLRKSMNRPLPVAGVKVKIAPLGNTDPAQIIEGTTDEFGYFRTKLPFGNTFGDRYFLVSCPEYEDVKPAKFHITAGLVISGNQQQTSAGNELPEPIRVTVDGPQGPVKGIPVYFKIVSGSGKARLTHPQTFTDNSGVASTQLLTADGYTGKYEIVAEIGVKDDSNSYQTRGIYITALALNGWKLTITILAGLAFFIFGMTMMSQGLQVLAGAKLKNFLQMFTGNRFTAILAGLGITALIQSSSATSVMVVGFVNAGLMSLQQGIGVIMGSAIGTTVTGQMVSFNLQSLAMPALVLGEIMLLCSKKSFNRGVAESILGFGMLFYGMMVMSDQSKLIADFPRFREFFALFDCTPVVAGGAPPLMPVLGAILIGFVLTLIVQSSSVTVSLTIAIASSGLLSFWTAFPLVLGDNIGTTVTAMLASVGTNRAARQTAVSSVIFKTLGVVVMLGLYYIPWNGVPCFLYLVDVLTPGDVFSSAPQEIGRHIANAHTLFSIVITFLFVPFVPMVAAISRFIVPNAKERTGASNTICRLEPHLLNSPSAAMDQVLTALLAMTREAMTLTHNAINSFVECTHAHDEKLNAQELSIDRAQHDIMDYLVKLTRRNLTETQSSIIPSFMHCVNDVERIGDRAINILQLVANEDAAAQKFSVTALNETREIGEKLAETGAMLIDGMSRNDQKLIDKVIKSCGEIKNMTARFESNHESRLHNRDCNVENGVIYVELLANLERITAHVSNLAERARSMLIHRVQFMERSENNS